MSDHILSCSTSAIRCECASTPLCLHTHVPKRQRFHHYTSTVHQNHAILSTKSCLLHAANQEQAQNMHVESPPLTAQQHFENLTQGVKVQSTASMNRACSTSCQALPHVSKPHVRQPCVSQPCVSQPAAMQSCTCSWHSAAGEAFSSYSHYQQCS